MHGNARSNALRTIRIDSATLFTGHLAHPQWGAVSDYASSNVPFYDSKFNRVLVTIERSEERSRVHAYLKDSLLGCTFLSLMKRDGST